MGFTRGMRLGGAALIAGATLMGTAAAAGATDYTWTGASTTSAWGTGANWAGGLSPTGTVGSLIFPQLTSAGCTASPPTDTCYRSSDYLSGLGANAISIDDNEPYVIDGGYPIALGAGGLTATPDSSTALPSAPPAISLPIQLTAPQTWSIDGGAQQADGLTIDNGEVTGNEPLTVDFSNEGTLQMSAQVGPLTASGAGTLIPAEGSGFGWINNNGSTVTLQNGAGLFVPYAPSYVGALSVTGGDVLVGQGFAPDGVLAVLGAMTFGAGSDLGFFIDQTGTAPATDYSWLTATGNISLTGATLDLAQGANSNGNCIDLNPGDVDTLIATSGGTVTGTFTGVPDGGTVTLINQCDNSTQSATAVIHYAATSVTATIASAGNAGDAAQNTSPPTISGLTAVGQTLTAAPGSWAGNPTFTYQWLACTSSGCNAISGATSTTYVPTAAQLGAELIVEVTGTNSSGTNAALSNPTTAVAAPLPVNTAVPTISGTTTAGDTLTASPGTWSGSPTRFAYQWLRCNSAGAACSAISGSTQTTYTLTSGDVGNTVGVRVTTANATGLSSPATSAVTAVIAPAAVAPGLTAGPSVAGTPLVGQTLTATSAGFSGGPLSYASAWERCVSTSTASCTLISGATSSTYTLTTADAGDRIRFLTLAYDAAGKALGTSAATAKVVTTAQVEAGLAQLLGPAGRSARLTTVLNRGGYSARYTPLWSGTLTVAWAATTNGHRVTVATSTSVLQASGAIPVKVTLTNAGRRLLKRYRTNRKKLTLSSAASFTLPGAAPITASRSLTLKP